MSRKVDEAWATAKTVPFSQLYSRLSYLSFELREEWDSHLPDRTCEGRGGSVVGSAI